MAQDHSALVTAGVWPQASGAVGVKVIERFPLGTPLLTGGDSGCRSAQVRCEKCRRPVEPDFAQILAPLLRERPQNRLIAAVITNSASHAAAPTPMLISPGGKQAALPRWTLSRREL